MTKRNNVINLSDRRKKEYIEQQASEINLGETEEFENSMREHGIDTMTEFFLAREEQSKKVTDWVLSNTQDPKDRSVFWSIIAEHFQHLLCKDEGDLQNMLGKLIQNRDDTEKVEELKAGMELDLAVTGALEQFQYSNMKEYLIEDTKNKTEENKIDTFRI